MSIGARARAVRWPPRADLALAGALGVFALLDVLLSSDWRGPTAVNAVAVPALALALAWRRRRPLAVLALVAGGIGLLSLAFGGAQSWSNVFLSAIAVYSAAAYGVPVVVVAVLAGAAVAVHDLRDPEIQSFGDAVWSSTLLGLTLVAGLVGRRARDRADAVERRAAAVRNEEAQLVAAAAAEERGRIARELHDIVAHSLGVLVLQAGAAEQVLERDPLRTRELLRSMRATGQEAVGEMSMLFGLIRGDEPASLEPQPSIADVSRLVETMAEAGLRVSLAIEGEPRPLPAALELSAYRVVQEGLTNALKHSRTGDARVRLRYGRDELEVEVENDGDSHASGAGSRHGLTGMRERVAVFDGRLDAGPRTEGGWIVRAAFPLSR